MCARLRLSRLSMETVSFEGSVRVVQRWDSATEALHGRVEDKILLMELRTIPFGRNQCQCYTRDVGNAIYVFMRYLHFVLYCVLISISIIIIIIILMCAYQGTESSSANCKWRKAKHI